MLGLPVALLSDLRSSLNHLSYRLTSWQLWSSRLAAGPYLPLRPRQTHFEARGRIRAVPGSGLLRPLNGDGRSAIHDGLDDLAAKELS